MVPTTSAANARASDLPVDMMHNPLATIVMVVRLCPNTSFFLSGICFVRQWAGSRDQCVIDMARLLAHATRANALERKGWRGTFR